MQVTDYEILTSDANTGVSMRQAINAIFGALKTNNEGSTEPLNPFAFMTWVDTSNATYYYAKERNHTNDAWITRYRYTVSTKVLEVVSNGVVLNDANFVHKTGDETIADIKTFTSSPIIPNATTATQAIAFGQAVNLTAAQTIAGIKTFSSSPIVPVPTLVNQAISMGNIIEKTGAGIGYGTGSGGTVIQLTSKGTSVTLNKPCGQIIMNNASLAGGASVTFSVANSSVTSSDMVLLNFDYCGSTYVNYSIEIASIDAGAFVVRVKNISAGALGEAPIINFAIIKGATA